MNKYKKKRRPINQLRNWPNGWVRDTGPKCAYPGWAHQQQCRRHCRIRRPPARTPGPRGSCVYAKQQIQDRQAASHRRHHRQHRRRLSGWSGKGRRRHPFCRRCQRSEMASWSQGRSPGRRSCRRWMCWFW